MNASGGGSVSRDGESTPAAALSSRNYEFIRQLPNDCRGGGNTPAEVLADARVSRFQDRERCDWDDPAAATQRNALLEMRLRRQTARTGRNVIGHPAGLYLSGEVWPGGAGVLLGTLLPR